MQKIIIIGAGPGGYETAATAARNGFDVTLIEANEVGGTCLNEGCIPTKALCRTASLLTDLAEAAGYGVDNVSYSLNFPAVMARKEAIVAQLKSGVETLLSIPNLRLVKGTARFVDAHTVEAAGETFTADYIIIATGSVSAMLPIPGHDLPGVITSREMLSLDSIPKRLCIIGAGVIGLEFASIFRTFGSEVTVVEFAKEVLPHFDSDLAKRLRQSLGKRGITIETQSGVTAIEAVEDGLKVIYERKGKTAEVVADKVLMAVGRRANTASLNLADVGVETDRRGIVVNDRMQTSVPHIYAIGDVNGLMMLAHAASFQGERALHAIMGRDDELRLDVMPAAVFTMPEVATVGMTEDDCKAQGVAYSAKKAFFRANGKALCLGESEGYCKLIVAEDGKLLGCHIYGPHASDLVQEACALITKNGTVEDLRNIIHTHPTLSEVVMTAARI